MKTQHSAGLNESVEAFQATLRDLLAACLESVRNEPTHAQLFGSLLSVRSSTPCVARSLRCVLRFSPLKRYLHFRLCGHPFILPLVQLSPLPSSPHPFLSSHIHLAPISFFIHLSCLSFPFFSPSTLVPRSIPHTHTLPHSLSHTHTLPHSLTHIHTLPLTHSLTYTPSHSLTHSLTHNRIRTAGGRTVW
jgi:hypothetical protein